MELEEMRRKIESADYGILKLLNERMEAAVRLRKLKTSIADPEREKEVLKYVRAHSRNMLNPDFSEKLFRLIMEESKALQAREGKLAGFQGEHGAYSEVAALSYDSRFIPMPCTEFNEVFEGVKKGQLDFGLVPVENSLEGAIAQVNDLLIETDLKIAGEISIPIHHNLLALPGTDYRDIRAVYSHPQALAQCRGFISRNKLEPKPFYDTAGAAKMLSEERMKGAAVIASALCAELYNLEIIKENIEDHGSNSTRFLVLAKEAGREQGDKCSIIFSTKHEAGALFRILKVFADAGINLTRIESRRIRDERKYAFLLDFQGSDKDEKVRKALSAVESESAMYKFMGCYKEVRK
ncbi:Prephenate dehydratase [uncultured archaeon]|nr:Prephenate dehydratase [uncultured archaeon]